MRIQCVVLEYHRDIAVFRYDIVDQLAVDIQFAFRNFFQSRDHTQSRRFSASGRSDEYDKFFILNVQIKIRTSRYSGRINLVNTFQ